MKFIVHKACPCRNQDPQPIAYTQCCGLWHHGWQQGEHEVTPEQLMRSRYSAYALAVPGNPHAELMLSYLLGTWHVSTMPGDLELSPTQWLGLQILHTEQTAQAGVVEFVARYKVDGKAHKMHEISRFTLQEASAAQPARWLYLDGQVQQD